MGVRLRTGKTNVIALVLNTQDEIMGFTNWVILVLRMYCETQYHLISNALALFIQGTHRADPLYRQRQVQLDGIIFSRTEPDDQRVHYLTERDFPFATHGRTDTGIEHPAYHDFDNFLLPSGWSAGAVDARAEATCPADSAKRTSPITGIWWVDFMRAADASLQWILFEGVDLDTSLEGLRLHVCSTGRERQIGRLASSAPAVRLHWCCGGIEMRE